MLTEWRPIDDFPNYSVSNEGFVRNDESNRRMALRVNQAGIVYVGLTKDRTQYKRAVALLVATAFVKFRMHETFTCPINLDGDRFNNRVSNLVWRPRWFATKYFQQLEEAHFDDHYPIEEVNSHQVFDSPWEVVTQFGVLHRAVLLSICNGTEVWPTRMTFAKI